MIRHQRSSVGYSIMVSFSFFFSLNIFFQHFFQIMVEKYAKFHQIILSYYHHVDISQNPVILLRPSSGRQLHAIGTLNSLFLKISLMTSQFQKLLALPLLALSVSAFVVQSGMALGPVASTVPLSPTVPSTSSASFTTTAVDESDPLLFFLIQIVYNYVASSQDPAL